MEQSKLETNFFLVLFVAVATLTFFMFLPYMAPLVLATTLAVVFFPFYQWLFRKINNSFLASFITVLLAILVVILPLFYFGYELFGEARNLYSSFSSRENALLQLLENGSRGLQDLFPGFSLDVPDAIQKGFGWLTSHLGTIFSSLAKVLFNFLIALFALFYFLKDGKKLVAFVVKQSPLSLGRNNKILERLRITLNSVVRGTLIIALLQGLAVGAGFFLFGVPNAVFWGVLSVFAALIPAIGVGLVTVPAVLYLYFGGYTLGALGLLLWGVLVVGLMDNLLRPYLMEREIKIHPLIILLSVLGGLRFFGPIGFLAGPLLVSFFFTLLGMHVSLLGPQRTKPRKNVGKVLD